MKIHLILLFICAGAISCIGQNKENMKEHKYTNSLVNETSPYLLQHAHNPVNWMAWNDETLELAKKENKLILISIGYSSCHWCHVMEEESFEDEEVAKIMNEHFINIKIDREERPDIDQIYMNAVQLMTGSGGWPLNCVALPDGRPVWGGTYFPKERWLNALDQIATLFKERPQEMEGYAERLLQGIKSTDLITINTDEPVFEVESIEQAVEEWKKYIDIDLGGRNGVQKFPMPNNYQFLMRYAVQNNDSDVFNFVNTTLTRMAYGGIYDQIGGGFSRYSVDKKWHVPHFEKMLYDNGQLVSLYSEAYKATGNELYKQVVFETLEFVERELMTDEGAFYSSLDADSLNSEGELEEGAFYVWTIEELQKILGAEYQLFSDYYNINNFGLWEHGNYVLIRRESDKDFAKSNKLTENQLQKKVKDWKSLLIKKRNEKPRPRRDDKSLTSWNALMLKGYVDAYTAFDQPEFLEIALKNARFLEAKQLNDEGRLNHSYKDGKSTINGYLEDYATLADAYICLYEATFDEKWLQLAKQLADYSFDHFFDIENSMFYFTSDEDTNLITRKLEIEDNVIPASNSIMARNLYKLSHYYSNTHYLKVSKQMLLNIKERFEKFGLGYSNWLQLMSDLSGTYYEIAISGKDALQKLKEINSQYIPNKLMAGSTSKSAIPLMEGRYVENETLIYVCVDGACKLPEDSSEKAVSQLQITFD